MMRLELERNSIKKLYFNSNKKRYKWKEDTSRKNKRKYKRPNKLKDRQFKDKWLKNYKNKNKKQKED